MMGTTAQDVVRESIALLHRSAMKAHGFSKSGHCWHRQRFGVQIVSVQLNKWNTAEEAAFVVNAAVYLPEVAGLLDRPRVSKIPREYNAELRRRFSANTVETGEDWWRVRPTTTPLVVANQIQAVVDNKVLPWFADLVDYRSAADDLRREGSTSFTPAAVCYHLAHEPAEAAHCLKRARESCHPEAGPFLDRITARLGVA